MNSLSDLSLIGSTRIIFLSYSYKTNNYFFPLLYLTGNRPVMPIAILCCGSMILVSVVCLQFFRGAYFGGVGSGALVDLMLFLV